MHSTRPPRRLGSRPWRRIAAFAAATAVLSACSGGISDIPGGDRGDAQTTLTLVAYAVPEPGWSEIIPAFAATPEGKEVAVRTSYGASADQSRAVLDGKPADIVNFSIEPDITRLVKAGKITPEWNTDVTRGIPFGSVVTLVVREGNPKNIRNWDDLLRPGIEVVTPSPLSSGSARWNLLAPYAAKSDGGADEQAGLDYLTRLIGDHVKTRPGSGREAADVFLRGTGDVLISYENEAIHIERMAAEKNAGSTGEVTVEHITPAQTFKIENPVAVITTGAHLDTATALRNFLYTTEGQRIWARAGFRPVDPGVAAEFARDFPAPQKLWTITDLGGWSTVDAALFDKDNGVITAVYRKATG